jgi:hypothetical protein
MRALPRLTKIPVPGAKNAGIAGVPRPRGAARSGAGSAGGVLRQRSKGGCENLLWAANPPPPSLPFAPPQVSCD